MPAFVAPLVLAVLAVAFAVLARTRARGGWFAPMAASVSTIIGLVAVAVPYLEMPSLRFQVLVARIVALPFILILSKTCAVQARRLSRTKTLKGASEASGARAWIVGALAAAPWVLFAGWLEALLGGLIWPAPAMEVYFHIPLAYFYVIFVAVAPQQFYLTLLVWLFASAAARAPNHGSRAKNASFCLASLSYQVICLCYLAQLAASSHLPPAPRDEIITTLLAVQDRLMILVAVLALLGLALGVAPSAKRAVAERVLPALLARDRFEAARWQTASKRQLRRPARALHYASEAAGLVGLDASDRDKLLATIDLTAALVSSPDDHRELNPVKARELLSLQEGASPYLLTPSYDQDVFVVALRAALKLRRVDPHTNDGYHDLDPATWYNLALVACAAAQLCPPEGHLSEDSSHYRRALRAYNSVKNEARRSYL